MSSGSEAHCVGRNQISDPAIRDWDRRWPGVHGLHACWPVSFWKVPSTHGSHEAALVLGATVPGLHAVCSVLPVVAKEPGSVGVQSSSVVRSIAFERVPAGHAVPRKRGRKASARMVRGRGSTDSYARSATTLPAGQ